MFAGRTRKAIGTGIAGVYAWAGLVIQSGPGSITAAEWYVLMGVGVAVAACYGLTNDTAPEPAPWANTPVSDPVRTKPIAGMVATVAGVPLPQGDPAEQHP